MKKPRITKSTQSVFVFVDEIAKVDAATKPKASVRGGGRNRFSLSLAAGSCESCGLQGSCDSPKIKPYGRGDLEILIVAEAPGRDEDSAGRPLVGRSGRVLTQALDTLGIDMDRDCWRTNVVQCRPPENRKPTPQELQNCYPRLASQIRHFKPSLILSFGVTAHKVLLQPPFEPQANAVRGKLFPSPFWNAWVGCLSHPSFVLHGGMEPVDFTRDLKTVFEKFANAPASFPSLDETYIDTVINPKYLNTLIDQWSKEKTHTNFDYETTQLSPYLEGGELLTCAIADSENHAVFLPLYQLGEADRRGMDEAIRRYLTSDISKSIQNATFEFCWSMEILGVEPRNVIWDTMVGAHVVDERKLITNLEFQTFENWGTDYKSGVDRGDIAGTDGGVLARYNGLDAITSLSLVGIQKRCMSEPQRQAMDLFQRAVPAFARMKHTGIKVDMARLTAMQTEFGERAELLHHNIADLPEVKSFVRRLGGGEFNLRSNPQLQEFLFTHCEIAPIKATASGGASTDAESLAEILHADTTPECVVDFLEALAEIKKLEKMTGTYLGGYIKLADANGLIHPDYNLHTTRTYRSSCSNPNFQNIPKRDPMQQQVRRVFVPHVGDLFLEADYASAEVRVLGMYSHDANLIEYIRSGGDMHATWASRIYDVPLEQYQGDVDKAQKAQRGEAKTSWVFPQFYGAWWKSCMASFPDVNKGESFWRGLERDLWAEFSGVRDWQRSVEVGYARNGFVEMFTGFRRHAPMGRNKIYNTSVQGTAFHLLLDALVRIDERLRGLGMRSRIVAQIHDSILIDVVQSELQDVADIAEELMTTKRFEWEGDILMEAEFDVGANWYDMEVFN